MRKIITMLCSLLSFNASATTNDEIQIIGFDCAEESVHMIEWLGFGKDPKSFVPKDIQIELLKQQPDSKLIKLECKSEPKLSTNVLAQSKNDDKAIVTTFSATFPVEATIELGDSTWILSIEHNYIIKNMETTDNRQLTQNFNIIGSAAK